MASREAVGSVLPLYEHLSFSIIFRHVPCLVRLGNESQLQTVMEKLDIEFRRELFYACDAGEGATEP